MEISISAVTASRGFTKALVRNATTLDLLKQSGTRIDTSMLPFDTLQVLFVDKEPGYAKFIGCKIDTICQIEVAVPNEQILKLGHDAAFLNYTVDQLILAVMLCKMPVKIEEELVNSIKRHVID